jgi:pimeloyl-ACP methyl ester carboxylesterase
VTAPTVSRLQSNGIELAYETFGSPSDPPVVLVMGLGTQMLAWPDPLCEDLAAAGRFVIRYDNRDVGLSTHLDDLPAPAVQDVLLRRRRPAYFIDDMSDDLLGLLDGLGLERAHLVGASMGGFITQTFTIAHPERVLSQTLMMTSTGSRRVGQAKVTLAPKLLARRGVLTREEAIDAAVDTFRTIGSRGALFDEPHLRELANAMYDRSLDGRGYLRQLGAVIAQRNRTRELTQVTVPTLVLHGLHDPLVAVSGGLALARLIRGARFVGYSGMGHDLPPTLWAEFTREIVQITGA